VILATVIVCGLFLAAAWAANRLERRELSRCAQCGEPTHVPALWCSARCQSEWLR
jgi:hypothetical protein